MDQKKIGAFLRELRSEKHMTQEQLAEILGVTNRSISRWENGVNMPDFDLGIVFGTLLVGALYTSRYMSKIQAFKQRLLDRTENRQ